jgi:hypothetical protein
VQEPPLVPRGLYLVRLPRPPAPNEQLIKRLQAEFTGSITKLKAMNAKLQAARVGGGRWQGNASDFAGPVAADLRRQHRPQDRIL